jgi:hypothetical protein
VETLRRFVPGLALVLGIAVLAGCHEKGDPIRQTLDRMARAAGARDAAGVVALLSADYRDGAGNGRSDIEQMLSGYFAAYEIVDVTLRDVSIERAEGAARARFRADLSGQPRQTAGLSGLLPSSASYRFDVRLARERSGWKVAWAAWETAAR